MSASLKRMFVGRALRTEQAAHERLSKKTALAVFSSDALSSVAYSTEAILLVLLAAGSIAIGYLVGQVTYVPPAVYKFDGDLRTIWPCQGDFIWPRGLLSLSDFQRLLSPTHLGIDCHSSAPFGYVFE